MRQSQHVYAILAISVLTRVYGVTLEQMANKLNVRQRESSSLEISQSATQKLDSATEEQNEWFWQKGCRDREALGCKGCVATTAENGHPCMWLLNDYVPRGMKGHCHWHTQENIKKFTDLDSDWTSRWAFQPPACDPYVNPVRKAYEQYIKEIRAEGMNVGQTIDKYFHNVLPYEFKDNYIGRNALNLVTICLELNQERRLPTPLRFTDDEDDPLRPYNYCLLSHKALQRCAACRVLKERVYDVCRQDREFGWGFHDKIMEWAGRGLDRDPLTFSP